MDMRLNYIVGYCPEVAIWKMLADISRVAQEKRCALSPSSIIVDGNAFLLANDASASPEFQAPEHTDNSTLTEAQMVWTLGSIAYYMSSGHIIFGGKGGAYQREHPSVALPVLQKAHLALTPVLQRCLCADPSTRITLKDLERMATQNVKACECRERESAPSSIREEDKSYGLSDNWPENMEETV